MKRSTVFGCQDKPALPQEKLKRLKLFLMDLYPQFILGQLQRILKLTGKRAWNLLIMPAQNLEKNLMKFKTKLTCTVPQLEHKKLKT